MPEAKLSNLTPEEQEKMYVLMAKMEGNPNPAPPGPDVNEGREWGAAPAPNPAVVSRILDPATWVKKQIDTMTSVGRDHYLTGVRNPRKNPITAGIAAQPKYEAKMKDAAVLARRKTGLEKTNMDEWVQMAETRGADNLVSGVTSRQYKIERAVGKLQPMLKAHLATIDAMNDVTSSDREAKMIANKRGLEAMKGKI